MTRRHLRRRLLLLGLLPLLLALVFAAKVGSMLLHDHDGRTSYDDDRWGAARDSFAANTTLNVLESWVAPFGEGTARYREGNFDGAVSSLETALRDVPEAEECRVRINLSLAHEGLGDAARAGSDPAAARAAYREGVVALADCLGLDEPEAAPDETRVDARAVDSRLREKLAEARAAEDAAERAPEDPAEAEQQGQLDERNQQGEDQRDKTEQRQQDEQPDEPEQQPSDAPPVYAW